MPRSLPKRLLAITFIVWRRISVYVSLQISAFLLKVWAGRRGFVWSEPVRMRTERIRLNGLESHLLLCAVLCRVMHLLFSREILNQKKKEESLIVASGRVRSPARRLGEERIALLPGFETKLLKRHPKVETFDLSLSGPARNPHAHMKAKAPTLHWAMGPFLTLFVPASPPPMTMKYCTDQLRPAGSIFYHLNRCLPHTPPHQSPSQ